MLKRALVTLLLVLGSTPALAGTCAEQFQGGSAPRIPSGAKLLCHRAYAVVYLPSCKVPLLVSYKLNADEIGDVARTNKFTADPLLPARESADASDYAATAADRYDRGHLAPAEDFSADETAMRESFYLSNVAPQSPSKNRGVWRSAEMKARAYAVKYGSVYITTGLLFEGPRRTIGSGVCVPSHYYKVVRTGRGEVLAAYLVDNTTERAQALSAYSVDVDQIEKRSGFNFR